mgnify:CR=1 FL=1
MPHIDWICDKCVADGLFLIDGVLGKRKHQGRVEYRIRWAPRSGESAADAADRETWQAVADLPSGRQSVCLQKIAAFNAASCAGRADRHSIFNRSMYKTQF